MPAAPAHEKNTGLRSFLQSPWIYEAFQRSVGKNKLRKRIVGEYLRLKPGDTVLDIGCGPGDLVPFLRDTRYVGYDISSEYIEAARQRFGDRAEFHDGSLDEVVVALRRSVDLVVMVGVLHHVPDDIADDLLRASHSVLRSGGRLVAIEPHLYEGQHVVARELIKRDRGQFVRSEASYAELFTPPFERVSITRDEKLLRVPYTLSVYEAQV